MALSITISSKTYNTLPKWLYQLTHIFDVSEKYALHFTQLLLGCSKRKPFLSGFRPCKKVNEYDQEIAQSHTADKPAQLQRLAGIVKFILPVAN